MGPYGEQTAVLHSTHDTHESLVHDMTSYDTRVDVGRVAYVLTGLHVYTNHVRYVGIRECVSKRMSLHVACMGVVGLHGFRGAFRLNVYRPYVYENRLILSTAVSSSGAATQLSTAIERMSKLKLHTIRNRDYVYQGPTERACILHHCCCCRASTYICIAYGSSCEMSVAAECCERKLAKARTLQRV